MSFRFWSKKSGAERKGFGALAVVLFLASVFTLLTTVIGSDAINLLHNNFGNTLQKKANFCSYAALQKCLADMDKTTSFDTALRLYYTTWNPGTNITDEPVPGDPTCTYTVRVDNNSQGALGSPFVDPDGTVVPVGLVYLKVEAKCQPSSTYGGRTYRNSVATLGFVGQVFWQHAVLGTDSVHIVNNSLIDSFYSNNTNVYPAGKSAAATVSTNGILNALELRTASNIQGRLRWGPGGNEPTAVIADGDVTVAGNKLANTGLYRVPRFKPPYNPANATTPVVLAPGEVKTLEPGGYKNLVVPAGATLILRTRAYDDSIAQPAMQYFFNDSVNVTGGTIKLEDADVTRKVEIYVGESVSLTAGAQVNYVTSGAAPGSHCSRLAFIFVGNGSPRSPQQMTIDNSKVGSVICGPGLDLKILNGSELYGAARAFTATVSASQVHWDRSIIADNRIRGQVAWTLKGLVQEGFEGEVDINAFSDGSGG